MRAAAFVLTGGESRRMTCDKALLRYRGATLVEWVYSQAVQAAGRAWLVGAPERYSHLALPCLPERYAGCGPLSGLEAALREVGAEWNLVLACDMPGVEGGWLRGLMDAALPSSVDAVVAASPGGQLEPLCAGYHARVLPEVQRALDDREFAVHKLLKKLNIMLYQADSATLVRNANTMEEWSEWKR